MKVVGKDITAEERWNEVSKQYLGNVDGAYHLHRRKVISSLYENLDIKDKVVLDFGCGEGNILRDVLSKNPKQIIGIDINKDLLNYAKENLSDCSNVKLNLGGITELEHIENQSIDLFFALNVIGYFSDEEEKVFYKHVSRVLKPKGTFIVCHSNELFDLFTFNRHTVNFMSKYFTNVPKDELSKLLSNPDKPAKMSANIRENPLTYKNKMKEFGFDEEAQAFANYHEKPPLLIEERLMVKDINERNYLDTTNFPKNESWKLMFQCSMYASRLVLKQE